MARRQSPRKPRKKAKVTRSSSQEKPQRNRKSKSKTQRPSFILWLGKWTLILAIWFVFFFAIFALWFGYDLPDTAKLLNSQRRPSITVLANDGKTRLATYGDLHGQVVRVNDLPPHMVHALLSIEDRRFYYHLGVDPIGLVRAIYVNSQAGHVVQGGSTLTQQLAKNFLQAEKMYDVNDRSLRRKIQEALMALYLEVKFTKDQILTMYLNRVYFGSGTFGLAAASQHYFGKPARKLTLYESAVLAGLLKAPSRYSPANSPEQADSRASQVLYAMVEAGYITEGERDAALLMATHPPASPTGSSVRYFCDWIIQQLENYMGFEDQDLIITTTLDARMQRIAEEEAKALIAEHGNDYNCSQLALIAMSPEGAIRAMIGGVDYKQSQFNRATQALRQPGSTFKLFTYLTALENGYVPSSRVNDGPVRVGKWSPRNYKYTSKGNIPLQDALAFSVNTVTVRLGKQFGRESIANMAQRLGVDQPQPKDLTLVLGTGDATLLEMTRAFATLPNKGRGAIPYGIISVKTPQGEQIYTRHTNTGAPLLDLHTVQGMNQMLSAVMSYGTGRNAAIPRPCAGKTGTTQNDGDALMIGYTPQLCTGVWAGNDDNRHMKVLKGGSMATRLWKRFMDKAMESYPALALDTGITSPPAAIAHDQPEKEEKDLLGRFIESIFG